MACPYMCHFYRNTINLIIFEQQTFHKFHISYLFCINRTCMNTVYEFDVFEEVMRKHEFKRVLHFEKKYQTMYIGNQEASKVTKQ